MIRIACVRSTKSIDGGSRPLRPFAGRPHGCGRTPGATISTMGVRHDEHCHVDFSVACKPDAAGKSFGGS